MASPRLTYLVEVQFTGTFFFKEMFTVSFGLYFLHVTPDLSHMDLNQDP